MDDLGPDNKTNIWVRVSPHTHPSMDFCDILMRRNGQLGQKPPRAMHSIGCLVVYEFTPLSVAILFVSILCVIYYRVHINEFSANLSCLSPHLFYKCLLNVWQGQVLRISYMTKSYSLPYSLEWEADVTQRILVINIKPQL